MTIQSSPTTSAPTTVGTVKSISRYPVKSMQGEVLQECYIDDTGVVGDHLFALVDTATGKLGSAKNPRKWGHLLKFKARYIEEPLPGEDVPPISITFPDGTVVRSDDPDVDSTLSEAVGVDVHLAKMSDVSDVKSEMIWLDMLGDNGFSRDGKDNEHGELQIDWNLFAPPGRSYDLGGLHVLTTSSLAKAQSLNPDADFDARRYRPNIVLDTGEPDFVEAEWLEKKLNIRDTSSTVVMNTPRCIMTTLPHEDLSVDRRTLRTIVKNNTLDVQPFGAWACLGVYTNITGTGKVEIGSVASVEDANEEEVASS